MDIALPLVGVAMAAILIRLGWGGRKPVAVGGWVLAAVATGWLTWADGAWGMAIGLTWGSVFALGIVFYAGVVSPQRAAKRAPASPSVRLPGRPEGIVRRVIVFLAVVPLSFLSAQWLAFAINAAMKGDAALDANSVATMLMVQPVVWALLMVWQLLLDGPRQMMWPPALVAIAATLIWVLT